MTPTNSDPKTATLIVLIFTLTLLTACPPREQLTPETQSATIESKPIEAKAGDPQQALPGLGLVYIFPGIEGNPIWLADARRGYRDGGVTADIRQFDWGRPFNILANLTDLDANREKAATVAAELTAWRKQHPRDMLDFVGYSGGGGVALLVLEALPLDVHVRNVVLVQPAVGPNYNLGPALEHADGHLTHFYSPSDRLILGWGTTTFGNADRTYVPAAGKIGFNLQAAVPDLELRKKVTQVPWSEAWSAAGHFGNHVGMLGYRWNRDFVAPAINLASTQK